MNMVLANLVIVMESRVGKQASWMLGMTTALPEAVEWVCPACACGCVHACVLSVGLGVFTPNGVGEAAVKSG